MNLERFEAGFSRLYKAVWLLIASFGIFAALLKGHEFPEQAAATAVSVVVIPWVLMKIGRWVYRGFVPKA